MNKTLKRRVFRHTALYAAILMFSHTGGGGGGGGKTIKLRFLKHQQKHQQVKKKNFNLNKSI
ncbi:hypothetical protein I7R70_10945, partial [Neisseria meningitidis]|nr:hypothetical protein [Neisseria meningitidis]